VVAANRRMAPVRVIHGRRYAGPVCDPFAEHHETITGLLGNAEPTEAPGRVRSDGPGARESAL